MLTDFISVLWAIPEFIIALVTSLAGYATSGVVMAAIWAWEHYHNRNLSWKACRWVLWAFLAASCFWVWYSDRPDMYAEIESKALGELLPHKPGSILVVEVRNTGSPSVAHDWHLSITTPDNAEHQGMIQLIKQQFTAQNKEGERIVYLPSDALYEKAFREPLAQGKILTGFLVCIFDGVKLSDLQDRRTQFHLTFNDVRGRLHRATDSAQDRNGPLLTYPGLSSP